VDYRKLAFVGIWCGLSYFPLRSSYKPGKFLPCISKRKKMNIDSPNSFLFSSKYRVWRHLVFWVTQTIVFTSIYFKVTNHSFGQQLFLTAIWWPLVMLYFCYPLMYWALPRYLLKGKHAQFAIIILLWAIGGWFINYLFRVYIFIPVQERLHFKNIVPGGWQPGTYLTCTLTAAAACGIVLFKHWMKKQQEWMRAEKEKVTAELQLLKAQVHPHFLFNTLNNIYSFSLQHSAKTPELILKLSSLLSYMLYDCKADEVPLEKELEVMKAYIALEKERYGNSLELSLNIEGDIKDQFIAPLLMLPFLENAFKHGTSEQLERPWLSVDIAVKGHALRCKIANSKNEFVPVSENGIGIQNVKKRLQFLYPGKHELKINDEGDFFVVSLLIELKDHKADHPASSAVPLPVAEKASA
ncbi:MAG: histidine kinase, partial [Bacteroidota bacterium]|nr:histidine kinase [Bacteroidota bacterium]